MAHAASLLLGAVLFTACACISDAAVFMPGDLFVATQSGHVQWRDPTGANYSPIRVINTGDFGQQAGMRHSPLTHDLWITNFNAYPPGPPPSVRIVDTTGTPIGSTSTPAQNYPESIVFDANGNAYVGGPQGALVELNAAGSIVTSFTLPVTDGAEGPDWIDLAADQSTIFYSYERQIIKRYDLGGGNPLADFADLSSIMAPGARLYSLRLLPDGGLLIAGGSVVYRLNSLGAVTQTYDVPSEDFFFSLALTPDALSFWTGSLGNNLGAFN
ncbi:MAG: hypothetical protein ACXW50_24215, partial [Candidatus Binatia bacterium]